MENTSIHPTLLQRKIVHIDMDCFYAAVEVRDNPSLKGKPVIVGGQPGSRGVVATCSYEARKFGIHSAMSSSQAYKRCPSAIFIKPNSEKYRAVSSQIRDVFKRYTHVVEPLSLDEAFLDVTAHQLYGTEIAKRIRSEVFSDTGLTCSAGVGPNKLIAKIASDMNKPNGITVVPPHKAKSFMEHLSLRKIPGVGSVTEKKLNSLGFNVCKEIWPVHIVELERKLGRRLAGWLYDRSRGLDERPVKTERIRKSLSAEKTFSEDINDLDKLKEEMHKISARVSELLVKKELKGKTITLKVKYSDFEQLTRCISIEQKTNDEQSLFDVSYQLLLKTDVGVRSVRLLGIGVSSFGELGSTDSSLTFRNGVQQSLF
ncbi:DNA polymerase IV [bacterium]|nr:DNA polymerase IV [bacterium]